MLAVLSAALGEWRSSQVSERLRRLRVKAKGPERLLRAFVLIIQCGELFSGAFRGLGCGYGPFSGGR